MATTKVSSKYQVVIPKEIRSQVGLRTGQTLQVIATGEIIVLVPDRPLSELRGFLKGMDTSGLREKHDRM